MAQPVEPPSSGPSTTRTTSGLSFGVDMSDQFRRPQAAEGVLADILDRSPDNGAARVLALGSGAELAINKATTARRCVRRKLGALFGPKREDPELLAWALNTAQFALWSRGERDAAMEMLEEASAPNAPRFSDRPLAAQIQNNFAWAASRAAIEGGDYASARDILADCLAPAQRQKAIVGIGCVAR